MPPESQPEKYEGPWDGLPVHHLIYEDENFIVFSIKTSNSIGRARRLTTRTRDIKRLTFMRS